MKNWMVLAIFVLLLHPTVHGQTAEKAEPQICNLKNVGPIFERTVCPSNVDWKNTDTLVVLMNLFAETRVPAGVSLIDGDLEKRAFVPKSFALRGILDELINSDRRYRWTEEAGVINFAPASDYAVLDIKIPTFEFENRTKDELLDNLKQTAEFKAYLSRNNISPPVLIDFGGLQSQRPPRTFTINFKNATVREILNEIVRLKGSSTWFYSEYESSWPGDTLRKYYKLYFLVNTY